MWHQITWFYTFEYSFNSHHTRWLILCLNVWNAKSQSFSMIHMNNTISVWVQIIPLNAQIFAFLFNFYLNSEQLCVSFQVHDFKSFQINANKLLKFFFFLFENFQLIDKFIKTESNSQTYFIRIMGKGNIFVLCNMYVKMYVKFIWIHTESWKAY